MAAANNEHWDVLGSLRETPCKRVRAVSESGTANMSRGGGKTRLAIAVFDRGECLCRALMDLDVAGFTREQRGIAAVAPTLVRLQNGTWCTGSACGVVADVIAEVETTPTRVDDEFVVVTRNSIWQKLQCFGAVASEALITANWMTLKLRDDLTEYVRNGAVVLGVSANDIDQQRQSTRILLRYSSHRVQTHEFIL